MKTCKQRNSQHVLAFGHRIAPTSCQVLQTKIWRHAVKKHCVSLEFYNTIQASKLAFNSSVVSAPGPYSMASKCNVMLEKDNAGNWWREGGSPSLYVNDDGFIIHIEVQAGAIVILPSALYMPSRCVSVPKFSFGMQSCSTKGAAASSLPWATCSVVSFMGCGHPHANKQLIHVFYIHKH